MSTYYLIHGFNVKDGGKANFEHLTRELKHRGHKVVSIDYGFMQRLRVRGCSGGVAKVIASLLPKDANVIAHSNGCALAYKAGKYGATYKNLFLINPALDRELEVDSADRVTVFYSPSDPWTRLARYIPFSDWGSQGRVGYTGGNPKYTNVNNDAMARHKTGHSDVLKEAWKLAAKIMGATNERK